MKIFLNRVLTGLVCLLAAGWAQGQQVPVIPALAPQPVSKTIQTNNPDIVVKQISCVDLDVGGVVVNKGTQAFSGILHIAVKDEEGDVVGRNKVRLRGELRKCVVAVPWSVVWLDCPVPQLIEIGFLEMFFLFWIASEYEVWFPCA